MRRTTYGSLRTQLPIVKKIDFLFFLLFKSKTNKELTMNTNAYKEMYWNNNREFWNRLRKLRRNVKKGHNDLMADKDSPESLTFQFLNEQLRKMQLVVYYNLNPIGRQQDYKGKRAYYYDELAHKAHGYPAQEEFSKEFYDSDLSDDDEQVKGYNLIIHDPDDEIGTCDIMDFKTNWKQICHKTE